MIDSSVKTVEKSNVMSEIAYDIKKAQFGRKIGSEIHLLIPRNINQSITKYFSIKTHMEIMNSSVKNLGEAEYDKQNIENPKFDWKIWSEVYLL